MGTAEFTRAWAELSATQEETAKWGEGPLLVLAGPGSGKTRVLTCHIAHVLDSTRDKNFRILGLTFTNKAADEMRTRVNNYVPEQGGRLFLGTFHSFCADVLRQHGTHLNINPNFNIYSQENDLQEILNKAVEEGMKLSDLITNLDKKTLPVIQRLKSLLVSPENCCDLFQNKDLGRRMEVVYPAYEKELSKRNVLDFNSLIFKAYELFTKFPAFAKRYRTVYPYICIDEFQDTNHAQYNLIRALTGNQHNNLFIVADDDQIIYQWNGASHKRLEEFVSDYSPEVFQLPINYRCPAEVVRLANSLIRHNFFRTAGKKPIKAFRSKQGEGIVRLLQHFTSFETEALSIAEDIEKYHSSHLGSVVVLARARKLLDVVERALQNRGLPAVISQRKDEFESSPFMWLHSILRLANDRQNYRNLEAVCGTFAQLTGVEIDPDDVVIQAQVTNLDYLRHWIKLVSQKTLRNSVAVIVYEISRSLGEGRDFKSFSKVALSWFDELVEKRRDPAADPSSEVFARYEEERGVWENLFREILSSLGDEITLEAFLQELEMHSKEAIPKPNTVVLMTIHGAKGKEFKHVYLIGLVEDELPSFQSKQKGDSSPEMEEERRNCFVAITRAIETLTLSYAQRYRGWPKEPSRFLFEMGLIDN
jgi:DNA helicase-2/ATP-dependent DNA helicase PcrA